MRLFVCDVPCGRAAQGAVWTVDEVVLSMAHGFGSLQEENTVKGATRADSLRLRVLRRGRVHEGTATYVLYLPAEITTVFPFFRAPLSDEMSVNFGKDGVLLACFMYSAMGFFFWHEAEFGEMVSAWWKSHVLFAVGVDVSNLRKPSSSSGFSRLLP